jgi:hypothetical protein
LIKVFDHPWVINFQVKYNLEKEDFASSSQTLDPDSPPFSKHVSEDPPLKQMNDTSMVKSMLSDLH